MLPELDNRLRLREQILRGPEPDLTRLLSRAVRSLIFFIPMLDGIGLTEMYMNGGLCILATQPPAFMSQFSEALNLPVFPCRICAVLVYALHWIKTWELAQDGQQVDVF